MADTINTTARGEDTSSAVAGWVVALLVIAGLILAAMYVLPRLATTTTPSTDINVTVPEAQVPATTPGIDASGGSGVQNQNSGAGSVDDTVTPMP